VEKFSVSTDELKFLLWERIDRIFVKADVGEHYKS